MFVWKNILTQTLMAYKNKKQSYYLNQQQKVELKSSLVSLVKVIIYIELLLSC